MSSRIGRYRNVCIIIIIIIIYRQIIKVEDSISLQSDLTTLVPGADRWRVKCNLSKCEVTRITHNKDKSTTRYQVPGTELRIVSNFKDLGVIMASDTSWTKRVEETVQKANKVLGLLKCTIGNKNKDIFQFCTIPSLDRSWNTLARCGYHIKPKTSMKLRRYKGELRE